MQQLVADGVCQVLGLDRGKKFAGNKALRDLGSRPSVDLAEPLERDDRDDQGGVGKRNTIPRGAHPSAARRPQRRCPWGPEPPHGHVQRRSGRRRVRRVARRCGDSSTL